jgi:hypothetical protein
MLNCNYEVYTNTDSLISVLLAAIPHCYFLVLVVSLLYHPVHGVYGRSVCYHRSRVSHVAALLAARAVNHSMKPSVSQQQPAFGAQCPPPPNSTVSSVCQLFEGCANIMRP